MATPQSPYSHPGPSTYYPPPPNYVYGNQGSGPYQYQYPIPHMNGHPSMHPPASPRMNGPGRGSYLPPSTGRGGYQNYHSVPHQQFAHPHHQPPQPPPPNAYPHQHGKYPPQQQLSYSPAYSFQPASPYSPAWPAQQPISPLPKQLSMPPPMSPLPPPFEPQYQDESIPQPQPPSEDTAAAPQSSPLSTPSHPTSSPRAQQSYAQLGSISTAHTSSSQTSSPRTTSSRLAQKRTGGWAIWSRRPHDPAHAPGIIISPRARPPQDVIQSALELSTPPPSPEPSLASLPPAEESVPLEDDVKPLNELTPEHTDVPSSATTETTPACSTAPDTPMPGSPVSTNTSLSLAATSPVRRKTPSLSHPSPKVETVTPLVSDEKPAVPPEPPTPSEPRTPSTSTAPPPVKKSWASLLRPSDSPASSSKSSLPKSSVVGFSIPGDSAVADASPAISVAPSKKSDLLALLTSGPTGPAAGAPRIRPRGLVNTGNMCFANAVLQVLVYCPQFYRLFTELGKYLSGPIVGSQGEGSKGTPLVDATIEFLKEFTPPPVADAKANGNANGKAKANEEEEESGLDSFIPTYVYDALKEKKRFDNMRGGHQEDAEEFLGFFLDTLEEELLSIANSLSPSKPIASVPVEEHEEDAPPQEDGWLEVGKRNRTVVTRTVKTAESPITKIFGGKSRSTLKAPHQKDSVVIEDWRSLRLDIQREQIHSVRDALQFISHPSSVQMTHPAKPGVTIDASQQILLDALPPILVLHMKRFLYDTNVGDVVKVGKQVSFSPELDIGSDLMAPARKMHSTRYKLFGVLYHHGLSASGGHYTLDVLHPNRDMSTKPREAWIRMDDELMSDVRPEDVFGASERDDRCAYLLFYRRVGGVSRT